MLVSLLAVYNHDNTVLDGLEIPEEMERDTLISKLLFETAELTLVYSNPGTLKEMIEYWSLTRIEIWNNLWNLAHEEYDPLVNYDRTETERVAHGKRVEIRYHDEKDGSVTTNNKVFGFNSNESVGKDSTQTTNGLDTDGSNTEINSGTDVTSKTSKGNIGVTTYQQMMKEELEMRPKLDIYTYIIEEFKHQFCVLVY